MTGVLSVSWEELVLGTNAVGDDQPLFLDTSAQVERLLGLEDRRAALDRLISDHDVFLSSTVFREFQVSVLQAYQFIADALRDAPTGVSQRFAEIQRVVVDHPGIYGVRQAKRIQLVLSNLMDELGDTGPLDPVDVADYCEGEQRRFRNWRFFTLRDASGWRDIRDVGTYIDNISCSVAREPLDPVKIDASLISCDKHTRACAVRSVLKDAKHVLLQLPGSWHTRRPKASFAAQEVARWKWNQFNGTQAIGQKLCWALADVLIAQECPRGATLVTTDVDFCEIGPVAGVNVLHIRRL